MTLVMLIVGLILGFVVCIGLLSFGLVLIMMFDKGFRHEMVDEWDRIDERW